MVFSKWNPDGWEWKRNPSPKTNLVRKIFQDSRERPPFSTLSELNASGVPKYLSSVRARRSESVHRGSKKVSLTNAGSLMTTNQEFRGTFSSQQTSAAEMNKIVSPYHSRIRRATLGGALGTFNPESFYIN